MKNSDEIDGWFNYKDVFFVLSEKVPDKGTFVECGAWLGKSTAYLCDLAQNRFNVFVVDHWKGSKKEMSEHLLAKEIDLYRSFLDNMGERNFVPLKMESKRASECFNDNSCDVIFLDMGHTYEEVKRDIDLWFPKLKPGGTIAGHDYTSYWSGVVKAVDEYFGKENVFFFSSCWMYTK